MYIVQVKVHDVKVHDVKVHDVKVHERIQEVSERVWKDHHRLLNF